MTVFEWLIVGHLIGDWLLQTEYQAMNKARGKFLNWALWSHCIIYAVSVSIPMAFLGIKLWWGVLVFASHLFLDRRWPVVWWIRFAKRTSEEAVKNNFWLVVTVDQVIHILILAAVAAIG
jgi:hypothetical protein